MVLIFEEQNRKASKTNLKRADRRDASICFSMLYAANNGLLEKQTYGNGFTVGHNYDSLDRETCRLDLSMWIRLKSHMLILEYRGSSSYMSLYSNQDIITVIS